MNFHLLRCQKNHLRKLKNRREKIFSIAYFKVLKITSIKKITLKTGNEFTTVNRFAALKNSELWQVLLALVK